MGLRVADRLGELDLLAVQRELLAKPGFEISEQRSGAVLADSPPLFGAAATNVLLDGVEGRDPFERLARNRRGAADGEFIKPAAHMRPTEGELDIALLSQRAIAGVAVDLENPLEIGEMCNGLFGLPVRRINVGDRRRTPAAKRAYIRDCPPARLSLAQGCRLMGISRSSCYPVHASTPDDTAIVEAIAKICDEFESMVGGVSGLSCGIAE
jgi:hypothetical protein